MIDYTSVLAIIPARGASKRLPKKNIKEIAGKPLIQWTIEAALKCKRIEEVVVSTDCEAIAACALQSGAKVPFIRPSNLAQDKSSTIDTVMHCIEYYLKHNKSFDYVLLLQATSPLRNEKHILEAFQVLESNSADAVISVCEVEHPPQWTNILPEDGRMDTFIESSKKNKRSQDFDKFYRLNGAIYLVKTERLLKEETFFINDNIYAYKMPSKISIDIDEEIDFDIANMILSNNS